MNIFSLFKKQTSLLSNFNVAESDDEQKLSFVATLVHDLRNSVIGEIRALEVLLKNEFGDLKVQQREILEMILSSAHDMNSLLSSTLDIYRYEKGVVKLNYSPVNIQVLVSECINEVIMLTNEKNLRFIYNANDNLPMVCCDRIQIKRVMQNILLNQIKYAYENSKLVVKINSNDCGIYINFENSSPYIPNANKIFEKGFTNAQSFNMAGFGIGLYASRMIVEAHNGNISVVSAKENKNVFQIFLPIVDLQDSIGRTLTF